MIAYVYFESVDDVCYEVGYILLNHIQIVEQKGMLIKSINVINLIKCNKLHLDQNIIFSLGVTESTIILLLQRLIQISDNIITNNLRIFNRYCLNSQNYMTVNKKIIPINNHNFKQVGIAITDCISMYKKYKLNNI